MDDSDYALDLAVQRLDSESSGGSDSNGLEPVSENCSVADSELEMNGAYPPSENSSYILYQRMSMLMEQRRKVNSLQHSVSGSEDNSSMASFSTDSDAGAKSAVYCQPRPMPQPSARLAVSDTEGGNRHRRKSSRRHPDAYLTEGKPVTRDEFARQIYERLVAVAKDREHMTRRARDMLRQQGKTYDEIMAARWYDLPEACKSVVEQPPAQSSGMSTLNPPANHHALSPLDIHSPGSSRTPGSAEMGHLNGMDMTEVEDALREWNISSSQPQIQQHRKPRHSQRQGSGCSSAFSATSDSGVGDTWQSSDLTTPTNNGSRVHAYLQQQSTITAHLPERDRTATAAAIALMSNSPQPENLNPLPGPAHRYHDNDRQRRHNIGHYSSGDDSSSVFTITSKSSTSDLFIPRRSQHRYNADSDDPQHYNTTGRPRRILSTLKRSSHMKSSHAPSPLTEQQHRQMQAHQLPRPASHTARGDTLIMYTLDELKTPFAKRLPGTDITLKDFKERVFSRKGEYRFFFKSFCPDVNMELLEEYSDDLAPLPLVEGKIVGRVERIPE